MYVQQSLSSRVTLYTLYRQKFLWRQHHGQLQQLCAPTGQQRFIQSFRAGFTYTFTTLAALYKVLFRSCLFSSTTCHTQPSQQHREH